MAARRGRLSGLPSALFDRLEGALAGLGGRRPFAAFRLAAGLGSLRWSLSRRWPTTAEVQQLLGPRADATRLARSIAALEARNRLAVAVLARQGPGVHAPLLVAPALVPAAPAVLATFHVGAMQLLGEALDADGRAILRLRTSPIYPPRQGQRFAFTRTEAGSAGDAGARAAALKEAVAQLESGGSVLVAIDGEQGAGRETRCLGRPLRLGRGVFAMAELAAVPIIPIVALWRAGRVAVETGRGVTSSDAVARWLEELLRRAPQQIGLGLLRQLLRERSG